MLDCFTVARAIGTVATPLRRRAEVGGVRGAVLWERCSDGPVDYLAPNHHTLSIYQGGGSSTRSCESRRWGFASAICLLPEAYDAHWRHSGYVKNLHLYFTNGDLEAMNWAAQTDPEPIIYGRNPAITRLCATLVDHLDWSDPADQLTFDHVVLAMMSQISRAETSRARLLSPATLEKIEARMRALEDGPPSLSELARDVGMSPRHLTRLYKATTQRTLSQRQRQIQIDIAQRLLTGPTPLPEIALSCGFGSQSHFTTVFRAEIGVTPAMWRKVNA